ncbi:MAG: glycosyltransferase family 2 protein [Halioglobus sp.]
MTRGALTAQPAPQAADVSVVIPSFNAGLFLYRAIKSVVEQSVQVAEILVVDDASTDGSIEKAEAYFPQITVLRLSRNAGVSAARNLGAEKAKAGWLAFLDADDSWLPDKIKAQMSALERSGAALSLGGFLDMRDTTRTWGRPFPPGAFHRLLHYPVALCASTLLVRRALFIDSGGYNASLRRGEDIEFYYRLALTRPRCCYLHAPLARYHHDNPACLTSGDAQSLAFSELKTLLQAHALKQSDSALEPVLTAATRHFRTKAYAMMAQGLAADVAVEDLRRHGDRAQLGVLKRIARLPRRLRSATARVAILPTRYRQGRLKLWPAA